MTALAAIWTSIGTALFNLLAGIVGTKVAVRLLAVSALATIYISCVVYFSTMVAPWMAGFFSSTYGQFLGLLFPPISGSILASLSAYWICVSGLKYVSSLTKMAVG